jgi:uncharacterized repeat protein (TIGR04076 family)
MYEIVIDVKDQQGTCAAGHRIGDRIIIENVKERGHICPTALHTLYPYIYAMKYGAEFPWAKDDKIRIACPDLENPVVFELRRGKIMDSE